MLSRSHKLVLRTVFSNWQIHPMIYQRDAISWSDYFLITNRTVRFCFIFFYHICYENRVAITLRPSCMETIWHDKLWEYMAWLTRSSSPNKASSKTLLLKMILSRIILTKLKNLFSISVCPCLAWVRVDEIWLKFTKQDIFGNGHVKFERMAGLFGAF